jgi:hypothetical protein
MTKKKRSKTPRVKETLAQHAIDIQRLLGILGYSHLRTRVARDAILVESGPSDDPHVRLRFCTLARGDWRAEVRTHSGRWEPIPFVGPRGNMVAWIHQDFPWLLADGPPSG